MTGMTEEQIRIREQLPDECNTTLDHANIHLKSALDAAQFGDDDQVAHDANMASQILRYIVLDYDKDE